MSRPRSECFAQPVLGTISLKDSVQFWVFLSGGTVHADVHPEAYDENVELHI